jgi:hypothetical protein
MKRDVGELHLHYGNLKLYYGVIKAVNDDQKETPDEMKFNDGVASAACLRNH